MCCDSGGRHAGEQGRTWGLGGPGPPPSHSLGCSVCDVANCPASLLPVGPLFGLLDLVPAWQPVGAGSVPTRLSTPQGSPS